MVPTRVLLEGPAIEPLLAQVRQEYGSGVRIISADKVRSGGFGGFFAKQHYELSVEVPDPTEDRNDMAPRKMTTATTPPPRAVEAPHTLEQLLERAESRDRFAPDEPDLAIERAPAERAMATDSDAGRAAGTEDTDDRFRSDAGTAFAELLAGLDAGNHLATSAPARPAPRPNGGTDKSDTPTVRPFRPAQATGAPINGGGARPLPPVPSLAELMGGLGLTESDAFEAPRPVPHAAPAPPAQPAPPAITPARSAAAAYGLVTASTELEPATPPAPPVLRSVHSDPVVANLVSVGMPEPMAAQITGGDTYAGVLTALASRPSAPGVPDAPGEILVLAGEMGHALPIAKQLLAQIGVDQTHLLLAGPSSAGTGLHSSRVMHDAKAAAARAERLQSADAPWVVVLDAPVGGTDPIWVNDMCDAIGATAVWAVIDATRKTADTARHLRTLGDVEALVVHGVDLTSDPATVLGLDLPIFSLDGKPATPHAWAAMLCARIAADVTPMAAAPRRVARAVRR
jgi:hypothetical protein